MEHANRMKGFIVAVGTALTALFGWFGWLIILFIFCMLIDYFTGSQAARKRGEWNSAAARAGRDRKIGMFLAVIVSGITDIVIGLIVNNDVGVHFPLEYTVLFCPLVVLWYLFTELGSIIENLGLLGAPVPAFLKRGIAVLKSHIDKGGEEVAPKEGEDDK